MRSPPRRRTSVVLVVLLVAFAGCASMPGAGGESTTPTGGTTTPTGGTTTPTGGTTTPTGEAAASDPGTSTATGTAADAGSGASTTTADTGAGTGGDGRSTDDPATAGETTTATDANATTGLMAVVVDGTRLNLSERTGPSSAVRVDADAPDTWQTGGTAESPTLAAALSSVGVDASATSLSFDGETYRDGRAGTDVVYRVDGEPVAPSEYRLEDGDEVWVLVVTNDTDAETPGEYIPPERLHVHGSMAVVVNGDSLDFSREKWQSADHNSHFHFEGGHADPWHAHSWSVTLAYALSTLADVDASESGITYNGTTYAYEGEGPTASVRVNGESVDPTTYYLTDGDSVRIVLESDP